VQIAAAGPGPAGAELSAVAAFLRAQRSPYLAAVISVTRLPSGRLVLRVAFGEPGPLGLLSPASVSPASVSPASVSPASVSPASARHAATTAAASSTLAGLGAGGTPLGGLVPGRTAPRPAPDPTPVSTAVPAG
jgi:hypothetical protein